MPTPTVITTAQRYDRSLRYARGKKVLPSPLPTCYWSSENILFYEEYRAWLLQGGTCEYSVKTIYLPMAGHVLGLNIKPHAEIQLEVDLKRGLDYIQAKGVSRDWLKACQNGLNLFRKYLRWTRGLGEEQQHKSFDATQNASDLPVWLVTELKQYQSLMQRNWRAANRNSILEKNMEVVKVQHHKTKLDIPSS
jgi:hypothetical protein